MTTEIRHAVRLAGVDIGVLRQYGDHVVFAFLDDYWDDPDRHVLGLWFEDHPRRQVSSALQLPSWFSNLLPEGQLRNFIAAERAVSPHREMELLAQVGHDLPGAVEVVDGKGAFVPFAGDAVSTTSPYGVQITDSLVKFSLAGVGLKFSVQRRGERFTLPGSSATGEHWIIKLPDPHHRAVPQNEYAIMSLASSVGIEVPPIRLVHRENTVGLPDSVWPDGEEFAFAIQRFDRHSDGRRIHIEDLAQVRGFLADQKYLGTFETVGSIFYRGSDIASLEEFIRRLAFNVAIGNGDAHLKNWSLIYPDGRNPRISPAYDLVATLPYNKHDDLGLKFGGSRRFESLTLHAFDRLAQKLGVDGDFSGIAQGIFANVAACWSPGLLPSNLDFIRTAIESSIERVSK